jgi:hypothetical protein
MIVLRVAVLVYVEYSAKSISVSRVMRELGLDEDGNGVGLGMRVRLGGW